MMNTPDLLKGDDVEIIAKRLLGATIITRINDKETSGRIVETEAYKAPEDKGSHAYGGRKTKRTATLYGCPGTAYIYLCYGMHHLFNVVTAKEGTAHAVLVRAIEPLVGVEEMIRRRMTNGLNKNLTNGPGKLTQALGISTIYNDYHLYSDSRIINLIINPDLISDERINASPRVGIGYAEECAHWPWRFRIKDNTWTSLPHQVVYPET